LGLFLQTEGAALAEGETERAGVYLTNALTGWEPPTGEKQEFLYPEMKEEHDKAGNVKQSKEILVVLGNPPYNGFAGVAVKEERDLSDAYRAGGDGFKPQGQGLNDLYIRFFRMAERCIAEKTRHGVVCFISNYSWLDGLSFPVMREHYLKAFDQVWIDCLNGDKYKTGKQTPDGKPDPSVFSTEQNREGIQVGTAVSLLVRKSDHKEPATVRFRHLWGQTKRADLLASLARIGPRQYEKVKPERALGLPFRPMFADQGYLEWPRLPDLYPVWYTGIKTSRDDVVVDIDEERLIKRMKKYFDPKVTHEEMLKIAPRAVTDAARFEALPTRELLLKRGFRREHLVRFAYRPFDLRWLYWEPTTKLLDEKRAEYRPQVFSGNLWLAAVQQNRKEFDPPCLLRPAASLHIIERGANLFPLLLREWSEKDGAFGAEAKEMRRMGDRFVNISDPALAYLNALGSVADAPHLFHHVAAVLHSPAYIEENNGSLCQDWPRISLPAQRDALMKSAELGRQVAAVFDTETPVKGVTAGKPRPELKTVGVVARVGGGSLTGADWDVTARWGIAGKGGVCMPGKGKAEGRAYSEEERTALREGTAALGLDEATALACWGATTFDVYLNDQAYWRNVPGRVWSYTLAGYQVVKKWLSYREKALLGRGLTGQEATEVSEMIRRIAALLLLHPALDANYVAVKAEVYPWPGAGAAP
jgi:predicted helicase